MRKAKYRILQHKDHLDDITYTVQVPILFGLLWGGLQHKQYNLPYDHFDSLKLAVWAIKRDLNSRTHKVIYNLSLEQSEEGINDLDTLLQVTEQYLLNDNTKGD
jgi:hypothetical protein